MFYIYADTDMERKSSEIIDDLVNSLEEMIDAQDDMWEEEKYCNHRERKKIMEEKFLPSKDKFKKYLDEYIDRRIETYCDKHHVQRIKFADFEEQQ